MIRRLAEWLIEHATFPGRNRFLRVLLTFVPTVRSSYGVILRTNARDLTNFLCISGMYGPAVPSAIASIQAKAGVFLDVGANCGLFSLLAARQLNSGLVIAFEPNPAIFGQLLENIQLNRAYNILPLNLALGNSNEVVGLSFDTTHSGLSQLTHVKPGRPQVAVVDPGNFSLLDTLTADKPIYVKIDVEGYEYVIISALLRTSFAKNIRMIITEIDNANLASFKHSPNDVYGLMGASGFRPQFGLGTSAHYDEVFTRLGA